MPPSAKATRRPGKRWHTPDQSQSVAATRAQAGNRVGNSSKGGSGDGSGAQPDEPVCRQTTVPVSSQAPRKGSQWPLWREGRFSLDGISAKLTALKPRSAL